MLHTILNQVDLTRLAYRKKNIRLPIILHVRFRKRAYQRISSKFLPEI